MKKILLMVGAICSVACLYADEDTTLLEQNFTVDGSVGYKSRYFFRGRDELGKVFVTNAKIGCKFSDEITAYASASSALEVGNGNAFLNRVAPGIGISCNVTDKVILDAGCKYVFYPSMPPRNSRGQPLMMRRHSNEVHLGVIFDIFMKLSLGSFYDFERQEVALEGTAEYSLDLPFVFSGLGIDVWAKAGYDKSNKPLGNPFIPKVCYCYYGAGADLAYKFNYVKAKVGVGYEGNSAKKDSWLNDGSDSNKNAVVFRASIDCFF
ncbi:MAG: hypothetical protein LBJ75_01305 [Puniceicoccales bacterium]|jgi:opacity protein-like surface antigen|nr:hypothetical protein [Puniceicoccales bacterium]